MAAPRFKALVVEETEDRRFISRIKTRNDHDLPKGDVLIKVHYSALNYKDALSAAGNKGVTRRYPHTPGIDAAGEVAESTRSDFNIGDAVLVTGFDLGMNTSGGLGQYIRVPADWVVPLPNELSFKESVIFGTAGLTAALSLLRLEEAGLAPGSGEILVTGASGGVGSLAVALLAHCGYTAVAVTGKPEARALLEQLGAARILGRDQVHEESGKPLLPGRFAGAVDTVGGAVLSYAVRSAAYGGVIACCGNAASPDLHLTVYPFILRAVRLVGIDSAECPMSLRHTIWRRLAGDWKIKGLEDVATEIGLEEVENRLHAMREGKSLGRVVVNMLK